MDKDSVLDKIRKLLRLQYSAEKVGNAGEAFPGREDGQEAALRIQPFHE